MSPRFAGSAQKWIARIIIIIIKGNAVKLRSAAPKAEHDDAAGPALHEHAIAAHHAGIDIDEQTIPTVITAGHDARSRSY